MTDYAGADLPTLTREMETLVKGGNDREAAEFAFAIAVIHQQGGESDLSRRYGQRCLELLKQCDQETTGDYAPRNVILGGVAMPSSYFHREVVMNRLAIS